MADGKWVMADGYEKRRRLRSLPYAMGPYAISGQPLAMTWFT
jgi:hypothetical protein